MNDGASGSGCQQDASNDLVMALQGVVQTMMTRLEALEKKPAPSKPSEPTRPDESDTESGEESSSSESEPDDDDAYKNLGVFGGVPSEAPDTGSSIDKALNGLEQLFQLDEKTGGEVHPHLAAQLTNALRKKPSTEVLNELTKKYPRPANIKTMVVPKTNKDVYDSMSRGLKYIDVDIQKSQLYLLKALVPLVNFISDVSKDGNKPAGSFAEELTDSLKLVTASFNALSQTRKDVARNAVRDYNFTKLCSWDTAIGVDNLFDLDVAKTVTEMSKTKKLGKKPFFKDRSFKPKYNKKRASGYKGKRKRDDYSFLKSKKRSPEKDKE